MWGLLQTIDKPCVNMYVYLWRYKLTSVFIFTHRLQVFGCYFPGAPKLKSALSNKITKTVHHLFLKTGCHIRHLLLHFKDQEGFQVTKPSSPQRCAFSRCWHADSRWQPKILDELGWSLVIGPLPVYSVDKDTADWTRWLPITLPSPC